jgi:hypothetical protein
MTENPMQKIARELNTSLQQDTKNESEFTALLTDAFMLCHEVIGKLIIGVYRARLAPSAIFSELEMKALVDDLDNIFPYMSSMELDFIARGIAQCFYINIGLKPGLEVIDTGYTDDDIPLIEVLNLIVERNLGLLASGDE